MIPENLELTPEQKQQVSKILNKSKLKYLFIAIIYIISLFTTNLVCLLIGNWYLADVDDSMRQGFGFMCLLVNLFFTTIYFDKQMKSNHDSTINKIKEVVTK
jgi:hypothetical protein